jgi:hypothetical protein
LIIFLVSDGVAQSKTKFHSQNYIGVLEGSRASNFQVLSINGFQKSTWFGGIGTGLDYYYFRSVPLFLSVSKYLCACERSFFFSADGGYNFVWDKSTGNFFNGERNGDFDPALYWSAGFGYKVGLKNKKDAVLMSLGFSAKHVKEEIRSIYMCFMPPCLETTEKYNYKLNRLSLRIGWQF